MEAPSVSEKKIEELFEHYAPQKDVMGPEEVMQFCDDLQVDPEDVGAPIIPHNAPSISPRSRSLCLCSHGISELKQCVTIRKKNLRVVVEL